VSISNKQVGLFWSCFAGRVDVYGTYDPVTKQAWQVKAPVTERVVADHLLGRKPYGVYLLRGETIVIGAVDFDHEDTKPPAEFVCRMAEVGIPAYIERSKSKGYHVWVFFVQEGVTARAFRALSRAMLSRMGLPSVEIFPKQDAVTSAGTYGNFINAPLFGALVEQGRTVFVDGNFVPFPDQWMFLAGVRRASGQDLETACSRAGCHVSPAAPVVATVASPARPASGSYSLMPCAQRMLTEGVTENQRAACFRLAAQLRKVGLPFEYAVLALTKWAEKNHPAEGKAAISLGEVGSQTRSAYQGRMYASCGCDDPSVMPYCSTACPIRRRRDTTAPPALSPGPNMAVESRGDDTRRIEQGAGQGSTATPSVTQQGGACHEG
jgi:hypothetical protein